MGHGPGAGSRLDLAEDRDFPRAQCVGPGYFNVEVDCFRVERATPKQGIFSTSTGANGAVVGREAGLRSSAKGNLEILPSLSHLTYMLCDSKGARLCSACSLGDRNAATSGVSVSTRRQPRPGCQSTVFVARPKRKSRRKQESRKKDGRGNSGWVAGVSSQYAGRAVFRCFGQSFPSFRSLSARANAKSGGGQGNKRVSG
jgi:hypothetical protein